MHIQKFRFHFTSILPIGPSFPISLPSPSPSGHLPALLTLARSFSKFNFFLSTVLLFFSSSSI